MSTPTHLDPLTNRQKDFCSYGGTFGVLLAVTCFIQLMVYGLDGWRVTTLFIIYAFAALSFFLLAIQKSVSSILLVISGAFVVFAEIIWIRSAAFSLVVLLLLLYTIIAIVFVFVEQIAQRLKQKHLALKAEEAAWRGKI
jgi:hypothetical protein